MKFAKHVNRRGLTAAVVSAAVLVPLGVLGGPALAGSSKSSAAQYQYKVSVCHKTKSKKHPWHQIRISSAAWKAHEKHGDFLVSPTTPCPPAAPSTTTSSKPSTATSKGKSDTKGNKGGKSGNNGDGSNGNAGGNGKGKGK
jgi:hypothetical protein